ncbi:hypothetical protein PABY_12980 [Pyrodictium abyssi]|uniref:AMMECR1 domain-containing protein n=1 Tax=Pyrodictium abyssi TaxID=54256 RepID=A0ABM8IXW7_9CREN|nr:hypothetical protein PABY_12980 [Pyrodictium abyssi]
MYGPSIITKQVRTFTAAFQAIIRYASNRDVDTLTGYDVINAIGPNRLAKALYGQVKRRGGKAVVLRVSGIKYRIIAYGGIIGPDRKVSAEEVAAQLLNYKDPDEFFNDLEAKGTPQITFFSLRLPRNGLDLDLIVGAVPAETRSLAINNSTYNYLGINMLNLSMFTYSSMSESRIREEIRSLLLEPLRDSIQLTKTKIANEIASEV